MYTTPSISFIRKGVALFFIVFLYNCDLFDLTPNESIQVKFQLLPTNNEVILEDFQFSVTEITFGFNSFYEFPIEHSDSVFLFNLQQDSSLSIEDALVEARSFKFMKLKLSENDETPILPLEKDNSMFVSGSYQGKDFHIVFEYDSSITLNFKKPLDFRNRTDTLALLDVIINTELWFYPKPNKFLDPTDTLNHPLIEESILNSFVLEKFSDCKNPKKCGESTPEIPTIVLADTSALESSGTMDFRIELDIPSTDSVVVYYETQNRAAKAGQDFVYKNDSLIFVPQQTKSFISVSIINDENKEPNEKFALKLLSSKNAIIKNSNKTATGTILNDDD